MKVRHGDDIPKDYTGIVEFSDGKKCWLANGNLHREDGPAVELADGTKVWYLNGKKHREDGPASEWTNGSKFWYLNGKYHREDGPAIEYADGYKEWYLNGERFRIDGPSVCHNNGSKEWNINYVIGSSFFPFLFIEEFNNGMQIKILTSEGIKIVPNLPGLKEMADNWEKK